MAVRSFYSSSLHDRLQRNEKKSSRKSINETGEIKKHLFGKKKTGPYLDHTTLNVKSQLKMA